MATGSQNDTTRTLAESAAIVADEANSVEEMDSTAARPTDEASALQGLTADIQDHADIERNIENQANQAWIQHEDEKDQKRIEKANTAITKLQNDERKAQLRLNNLRTNPLMHRRITAELEKIQAEIEAHQDDIVVIQKRISDRHEDDEQEQGVADPQAGTQQLTNESRRDFLIRTGKITPFSSLPGNTDGLEGSLGQILLEAEDQAVPQVEETAEPKSHRDLKLPGFGRVEDGGLDAAVEDEFQLRPRKKRRVAESSKATRNTTVSSGDDDESVGEFNPTASDLDSEDEGGGFIAADGGIKKGISKRKRTTEEPEETVDLSGLDDGKEEHYQRRLQDWVRRRSRARQLLAAKAQTGEEDSEPLSEARDGEEEWHKPCPDPSTPDHIYDEGVKLPGEIYNSLFNYQKVGVQWLGEMFTQKVGGILADEMGLGKTIQVISFLAGLHFSKKLDGPVIIVAPATVLSQWVKEFHQWWPPLRVSILHSSGSGMFNVRAEEELEGADRWDDRYGKRPSKSSKSAQRIASTVLTKGHVLVTTYSGLQTYRDILIPIKWAYAVLDEGHKIRNPNSSITYSCKSLQTSNRLILSGTPMQNNLSELWSLFDFVYPMRLGNLINFRYQFETPIKIGGYSNASNLQILAAEKCAQTLKDTISPYMLQRLKINVASDLPKKTEQVLFCKLTKPQREAYEMTLSSPEIVSVMNGQRNALWGMDLLTKICNHPDLLDPKLKSKPGYKWGNAHKSGKMQVVKSLLEFWKNKGDKVLLFSQGKLMLNILEDFVTNLGYSYLRMDGGSQIKDRQALVDQFNNDPNVYIFLLTTRVGGLGVNLTGANRVIIFDPNWNPAVDMQARERAWRLGQKREVTIFRLMTAGAIEEKIYHRQIFKQFLDNKVRKDAKLRPNFTPKDLLDMFTLVDSTARGTETETAKIFQGTEVKFDSALATPGESPTPVAQASDEGGDLSRLTGVASTEEFIDTEKKTETEEASLMSTILGRSGVHSAHSHDEIINGKKKISGDAAMTEREAERIAREAGNELRRAAEEARNVPAGQVTWTGTHGESGRPRPNNARRNAGPSSANVLANLSDRQNLTSNSSSSSGNIANLRTRREFTRLLTTFMKRHDETGRQGVPAKMILDHFNPLTRNEREKEAFKEVWFEICEKKVDNRRSVLARWGLKEGV